MPIYLKQHSYGEYVFDWAWAEAYAQHGIPYYPKSLSAIPFTPIQGSRILTLPNLNHSAIQKTLVSGLKALTAQNNLSSAHVLFPDEDLIIELENQGFLLRKTVQFHWENQAYSSFEDFVSHLNMKRRKNVRRERRIVEESGVRYRHLSGSDIASKDWEFFYLCYLNTYTKHQSMPYLNQKFFQILAEKMPDYLHLILGEINGEPVASSLLVIDRYASRPKAYGRYWGSVLPLPHLHFETAYYQAIEYCIKLGIQIYEGGAQGHHKLARGFLPVTLQSAHWFTDEKFYNAIALFLKRERSGISEYLNELEDHSPMKFTKTSE